MNNIVSNGALTSSSSSNASAGGALSVSALSPAEVEILPTTPTVLNASSTIGSAKQVQLTTLADDTPYAIGSSARVGLPRQLPQSDVTSLQKYLERPIRVLTDTFTTADSNILRLNPWTEFLSQPRVAEKLNHYKYIRGRMHARFVMNATPFTYGLLSVSYFPFQEEVSHCVSLSLNRVVQLSHSLMNPATSTTMELDVPFLSPHSYIDVAHHSFPLGEHARSSGMNLGTLSVDQWFPVRSASTPGDLTFEFSLYLWMTDVEVFLPTTESFIAQALDEYNQEGPISNPASALAKFASHFSTIPVIGAYARATSILSSSIANIASTFGFSKPTILRDMQFYRGRLFSPLSLTAGGDPSLKLTADPKQEITVDPAPIGCVSSDEMSIASIAQREGVIAVIDWETSQSRGDILAVIPVLPTLSDDETKGINSVRRQDMTPVAYVASAFQFWTGNLIYRIQVVASSFHRGRFQVAYVPDDTFDTTINDLSDVTWNKIIDVSGDRDYEFEVPWSRAQLWARNDQHTANWSVLSPDVVANTNISKNGSLVFLVHNALSVNEPSASVQIIVTVRAGDQFALAAPNQSSVQSFVFDNPQVRTNWPDLEFNFEPNTHDRIFPLLSVAPPEEEPHLDAQSLDVVPGLSPTSSTENAVQLTMGEQVVSIRSLQKRASFFQRGHINNPASWYNWISRMSYAPYDYASNDVVYSTPAGVFDIVHITPLTYFAPLFAVQRGGVRYKILFRLGYIQSTIRHFAENIYARLSLVFGQTQQNNNTTGNAYLMPGEQLTALELWNFKDGSLEFEVPYYSPISFSLPGSFARNPLAFVAKPSSEACTAEYQILLNDTTDANELVLKSVFLSAAEDYSLSHFVCTPFMFTSPTITRAIS